MGTVSSITNSKYSVLVVLSDDGSQLCKQMLASFSSSLAPGTITNRRKQAEEYIKFALIFSVPVLHPSLTKVCMYAQHLANLHAAPGSIKNYMSGAKTWVSDHCGNINAFLAPQLSLLIKGFTKNSTHVTSRAQPLQHHHLRAICEMLDSTPSAPAAAKPALLVGFACFLRTSNLLSPTATEWGGPHTLVAGDLSLIDNGLLVYVRSTKTRSRSQGLRFFIPGDHTSDLCPVAAWITYKNSVRPWALGPAFVHQNRTPLTSTQLVKLMRLTLNNCTDIIPAKISMHSIRRGAAQAAADQGVPLNDILARGTWRSISGLGPYLAP